LETCVTLRPSLVRDEAGTVRVEKAHGYVTHGSRLLAFTHRDSAEPGVQIPAGTIRAGEDPEAAVVREVEEETGLVDIVVIGPLATYDHSADPVLVPAGHENQRRHASHLETRGAVAESWVHWERGDGDTPPIAFEFS
jgi:8-oxo-dGTP pyrophosphatase MutT (NUDIX family)